MARDTAVAARKGLPTCFRCVVEAVQVVKSVCAISGEHIRTETVSAAFARRHEGPDDLASEALILDEVFLDGHAVEPSRRSVARVLVRLGVCSSMTSLLPQLLSHLRRDGKLVEVLVPVALEPDPRLLAELGPEIGAIRARHLLERAPQRKLRLRATPPLILEFAPVDADRLVKARHKAVRIGNLEVIGALGSHQPLPVYHEFIPFGLPAEHR